MKTLLLPMAAAIGTILAEARAEAQVLMYGLTPTNSLVLFGDLPGPVVPGPSLTGAGVGETVVSIDFRPFTGELHAVSRDAQEVGRLYTVDRSTGAMTAVPLSGVPLTLTGSVDIDFNPAAVAGVNALRIVTSTGQNYRLVFGPAGATVNADGALHVAEGGAAARVLATAYTRNTAGLPGGGGIGGTAQYALDAGADVLYRVNPPNDGTLVEPKPLGIDIGLAGGLDIVTGTDRALASLEVAGVRGLYEINLATGGAVLRRALPQDLVGLAAALPARVPSALVYGLTTTNSLVVIPPSSDRVTAGPVLKGLGAGESAMSLDFRPFTSALYVLTRDETSQGRVYTVDLVTGDATPVTLGGAPLRVTGTVDIDFNPAAGGGTNALRIVTSDAQNYRLVFGPETVTVMEDGAMNLPGEQTMPQLVGTAYANNRAGLPGGAGVGGTIQYAMDAASDTLYRVNPPNNGTLTEPRKLPFDVGAGGGLDLVTGSDVILAGFDGGGGGRGLYTIDLATGGVAWLRPLPDSVVSIAAVIPSTPVTPVIYGLTTTNAVVPLAVASEAVGVPIPILGLGESEIVVGVDFRPRNGLLHAVTRGPNGQGRLYSVTLPGGMATAVPLAGAALILGEVTGIDFNPAANGGLNALRVLTGTGDNYRLVFTADGATVNVDGPVNVPGGTLGAEVFATGYANNQSGLPNGAGIGGTRQYALDAAADALYRVDPPNNGTLTERRALPFDVSARGGLDVVTGSDRLLAVLEVAGAVGLYDLGAADGTVGFVRSLPGGITDLAVPTPATLTSLTRDGGSLTMEWVGGVGPFSLESSDRVEGEAWEGAMVSGRAATVPVSGEVRYFRVVDSGPFAASGASR